MYGLTLTTAAATEPLTAAEAKAQINLASANTDHDTLLAALIARARDYCESYTNRQFVTATYTATLDALPVGAEPCYLPKAPLQSVAWVKYLDADGVEQTLSGSVYRVTTARDPGYFTIDYQQQWPAVYPVRDAVTVRYVAGYGAASAVPVAIKQAMLLLVGYWFANRGDAVDLKWSAVQWGVHALLDQYRVADDFLAYGRERA